MAAIGHDEARLPTHVVPSAYIIEVKTDLVSERFSGVGTITLEVKEATDCITLHAAAPLQLKVAALIQAGLLTTTRRKAERIEVDEKRERVRLYFSGGQVKQGKFTLAVRWEGKLDRSMKGYYLSAYPTPGVKGQTSFYAVTQHQPTSCRRTFPCFDEPSYKATFEITMLSRKGTVSLSNSHVASTEPSKDGQLPRNDKLYADLWDETDNGQEKAVVEDEKPSLHSDEWELVHFAPTPKMSTYIVALANGDLKHKESSFKSTSGTTIPLRFYATPDQVEQTQLALETTAKLLPIFETVFAIPYPLAKLDTLVVSDFDLGAMENWGLITGRTSVYCCDPTSASLDTIKGVVSTTSHELAHMHFGDLVSLDWWSSLWLNEAFATFMGEHHILSRLHPSWRLSSTFVNSHLVRALTLDAQRSSHPVEVECESEATISQIFDAISYSKGASVLRMLMGVLGEVKFLEGVTIYLKAHAYANATTQDLFDGLSQASGRDVGKMMAAWTDKIGYPLLTVTETDSEVHIRQNRYLSSADATDEEDSTIWHVPLQILSLDQKTGETKVDSSAFLTERETSFKLPEGPWKLNAGSLGVYRTLYTKERLQQLAEEAVKEDSALTLDDRMNLLQDASALSRSGHLRTSATLSLVRTLARTEKTSLVWDELLSPLAELAGVWWEQDEKTQEAISRSRREMVSPLVKQLGWEEREGDGEDEKELRWLAIQTAAGAGHEEVLAEYKRRFKLLLDYDDESAINGDLRRSIYRVAVRDGGKAEYEKILAMYRAGPPTPAHKSACIAALGEPRDPELVKRSLAFALSDEVKTQDVLAFVRALSGNPKAKRELWATLKRERDPLVKRFAGNFQIGGVIKGCFATLTTEADAHEVEAFFAYKDNSLYSQALLQGIESIRANASWLKRDGEDVKQWLQENE